ncbi:hypothetical protein [Persicobacter diffluens]|uniref:Uncharacterized protein n=1 Tax=Persicobacter diffluens TaxID=981 RepID=A0AAN4W579_9BACT|nr:hypothetical protein PEDI_51360 [Persicobacter diffluens]GJM65074.1 hypothetical protein PEDI_56260 [Persicobacter diffluens]
MADINVQKILEQMLDAAKGVLENHWDEAKPFAEQELKALAENLQLIGQLKLEGKITQEQAKYYLEIQKSSVRIVLLTIEGLGILAVEAAINAALNVIRSTVNTALGWTVL